MGIDNDLRGPLAVEQLPQLVFGLRSERHRAAARSKGLEFLKLVAPSRNSPSVLAFETRREQLQPWGNAFAEAAAAAGMALDTSAGENSSGLRLACIFCTAKVTVDVVDENAPPSFSDAHRLGCQYSRVRGLCSPQPNGGSSVTPSLQTRRLKTHLRNELTTTKATVAREFDFGDDAICMAMARQFLHTGRPYDNAGSLVDALTNITIADSSSAAPIIEGIAELVNQLTPPPRDPGQSQPLPSSSEIATGGSPTANEPQTSPKKERDLRREPQALYLRSKCRVCRERDLEFIALPCSHFVFCESCMRKTKQCPVCNTHVTNVIRTYRS